MNCSGSEVPFGNLLPIGFGELCESTEDESVSPGCHAIDVNDLLVPSRFTSSFEIPWPEWMDSALTTLSLQRPRHQPYH